MVLLGESVRRDLVFWIERENMVWCCIGLPLPGMGNEIGVAVLSVTSSF